MYEKFIDIMWVQGWCINQIVPVMDQTLAIQSEWNQMTQQSALICTIPHWMDVQQWYFLRHLYQKGWIPKMEISNVTLTLSIFIATQHKIGQVDNMFQYLT